MGIRITTPSDAPVSRRTSAPDGPVVRLRDVAKIYKTPAGDFTALKDVSFDLAKGEFATIVGKSGAGKSTLVNVMTGVDTLTRGEIWVNGTAVHALSEDEMALWRGRTVGIVYQSFELMPQLSLLDNVLLPMDLCGLYRGRASVERAADLLAQVGLADHIYKPPSKISGGQKQRVAIARALANDPPILVADEPTGNLDSATADDVWAIFTAQARAGKTVLIVTHDASLASRSDPTLELTEGRIEEGPGLKGDPRAAATAAAWSLGQGARYGD